MNTFTAVHNGSSSTNSNNNNSNSSSNNNNDNNNTSSIDNLEEWDNCIKITASDQKLIDFVAFWLEGILLTVLAIGGLATNAISISILQKKNLGTFFSQLLTVLLLFDSIYLLLSIIEAFRMSFKLVSNLHIYLFPHFLYPLHSFFMVASIYMTIIIAIERHRAVVFPLNLRVNVAKRKNKRRLCMYIALVLFAATLITIPRLFEMEIVMESITLNAPETFIESEETILMAVRPHVEATFLLTNSLYNVYYVNLTYFTLTCSGPMLLLIFFYCKIFNAVRCHNRELLELSSNQLDDMSRRKQEMGLSALCVKIILVFLVCHTPRVLINLKEVIVIDHVEGCYSRGMTTYGIWMHIVTCLSHLLLVGNASANIFLYMWHNKVFKENFLTMFCGKDPKLFQTLLPAPCVIIRSSQVTFYRRRDHAEIQIVL